MSGWLLRAASPAPGLTIDVSVSDGRIARAAPRHARVIELEGRPTLCGLADHHVHLLAQAAAWRSVNCSPEALRAGGGLRRVLETARELQPDGWLRGIGYDVAASGPLRRAELDGLGLGPVRIQDRTGILWMLDSLGLDEVLPDDPRHRPDGVERDAAGHPTGVLRRLDGWLRTRLRPDPPDLAPLGRWLARRGVTRVTDATATNGPEELALLAASDLPQRITAMTASPSCPEVPGVTRGPVKIVLDEAALPGFDDLTRAVAEAHAHGRPVAVHCVDVASLALALACGVGRGDRIEHATLLTDQHVALLARRGVTAVLQPGFLSTRGDRYLDETDPVDRPNLYRLGSLLSAGVDVLLGSDAPHGPLDPWDTVAGAVYRRTPGGAVVGAAEAVDALTAVRLMTTDPTIGLRCSAPADFTVLDEDWESLSRRPRVALTMIGGEPVHTILSGVE